MRSPRRTATREMNGNSGIAGLGNGGASSSAGRRFVRRGLGESDSGLVLMEVSLPLQAEHEAVQPATDAEETDTVAGLEELAFLRDGRGDRQRYGADVAEVLEGAEVLLRRN